jgi:hypothetical protein
MGDGGKDRARERRQYLVNTKSGANRRRLSPVSFSAFHAAAAVTQIAAYILHRDRRPPRRAGSFVEPRRAWEATSGRSTGHAERCAAARVSDITRKRHYRKSVSGVRRAASSATSFVALDQDVDEQDHPQRALAARPPGSHIAGCGRATGGIWHRFGVRVRACARTGLAGRA